MTKLDNLITEKTFLSHIRANDILSNISSQLWSLFGVEINWPTEMIDNYLQRWYEWYFDKTIVFFERAWHEYSTILMQSIDMKFNILSVRDYKNPLIYIFIYLSEEEFNQIKILANLYNNYIKNKKNLKDHGAQKPKEKKKPDDNGPLNEYSRLEHNFVHSSRKRIKWTLRNLFYDILKTNWTIQ